MDGGIFGLRGHYEFTDVIRASAAIENSSQDFFLGEYTLFNIGGGYQVADGLWVDASYGQLSVDGGGDNIDRLQLAISYDLGERMRIDSQIRQDIRNDVNAGFGNIFPDVGIGFGSFPFF